MSSILYIFVCCDRLAQLTVHVGYAMRTIHVSDARGNLETVIDQVVDDADAAGRAGHPARRHARFAWSVTPRDTAR
ncbi:hypothetical protein [Burkholderia pseudomultivorans]|uniref:hypothetical protein n=1 Tax=Burkholderia pseudomultivorans TaxID=1207504 RepID=UPI001E3C4FA4|nr:hypothetical protein [Burkholderia pseudomultivorans]